MIGGHVGGVYNADDLYDLLPERAQAGRSLIATSNRPSRLVSLFPNPVVAEPLLDWLIRTSHQVFMNSRSYRPDKRSGRANSIPKQATK